MKTRLLGAAVLLLLLVIFVPMFFASKPPTAAGDQAVSLAIPPAPDRDLQTKTMSLAPNAPADSAGTGVATSGNHLASVDIGSRRPQDVGTDAAAGTQPSTHIGSGDSASQPVIPMQGQASTPVSAPSPAPPKAKPEPPAAQPTASKPTPSEPPSASEKTSSAAPVNPGHGSYTLNLSAYASDSGAARLVRRVTALGYPASGRVITQAGHQRTLVIAGPFETRTAAEAARLKITQSIPGAPARLQQDAQASSAAADPAQKSSSASESAKPGGYAVQLVAVSSKVDALVLRNKLRANGFDGFIDSVQSGGKRLWRVRAGPQTQRADAQHVLSQIKAKLGISGVVVSVP